MKWVQERLSEEQLRSSYAWKTLLLYSRKHRHRHRGPSAGGGLVVAGGSDAPIETPNPFTGMHDAMLRSDAHRGGGGVFRPLERLSFSQALWIYTVGGAYAAGAEDVLGHIPHPGVEGHYASRRYAGDCVLVDPAVATDPSRLLGHIPHLVVVGGRIAAVAAVTAVAESSAAPVVPVIVYSCARSWCLPRQPDVPGTGTPPPAPPDLSQATYLPGRGGAPLLPLLCQVSGGGSPLGLHCACILRGKFCVFT